MPAEPAVQGNDLPGRRAADAAAPAMRAVVRDSYGSADLLDLRKVERPRITNHEVLVRVRAAGLDRGVWHIMTGQPYLLRIAGYGIRRPRTAALGRALPGVVEAVGADVKGLAPGDAVFGTGKGSLAEYAAARPDKLARMPATLTHEQAAAVPVSGPTALQSLRDRGRVQAGQHVLIIGASGGVGTFAVQIAKAFGAEVTGVCSTAKTDLVRSIGADHVIDYTVSDIRDGNCRYDVILDIGGGNGLSHLRPTLTPRGRFVMVGGESGGRWLGGMDRLLRAHLLFPLVSQKLSTFIASEKSRGLRVLRDLIESGKIAPAIDR